jgi:nucleoside 2-deoxyribosyltransferase
VKIYLAGGIFQLSDTDARDWRELARERFRLMAHEAVDPMRRDYRGRERGNEHQIVHDDIADISASGAVLAMCRKPSWGTATELRIALTANTPVLAIVDDVDNVSPWLRYHATGGLYESVAAACDWIMYNGTPLRCSQCGTIMGQSRFDRRCMACASRAAEIAELKIQN